MSRTAFFILCGRPDAAVCTFADRLAEMTTDVFVIADRPGEVTPQKAVLRTFDDHACAKAGFICSSPLITRTPIAWDKALLIAGQEDFDHVWFCEDDVAFDGAEGARELLERTAASAADLICADHFTYAERPDWPHWNLSHPDHFRKRAGFLPLARLSRRLITAIAGFARENHRLYFIETMVPSLVDDLGMTIEIAPGVSDHFCFSPPVVWWELADAPPDKRIWHPVKDRALMLKQASRIHYSHRDVLRARLIGRLTTTKRKSVQLIRSALYGRGSK